MELLSWRVTIDLGDVEEELLDDVILSLPSSSEVLQVLEQAFPVLRQYGVIVE